MKNIFAIILFVFIAQTNLVLCQNNPCASIDTVFGLVTYKFDNNSKAFVCQTITLENGKRIDFCDDRGRNSSILNQFPILQSFVGADTIYEDKYNFWRLYLSMGLLDSKTIDSLSYYNLYLSKYKRYTIDLNNGSDIIIFSDHFYYLKNDFNKLYIYLCFNLFAEVIYYQNLTDLFKFDLENDCAFNNKFDYIVLSKVLKIEGLTENDLKKYNLIKSDIDNIRLYIEE